MTASLDKAIIKYETTVVLGEFSIDTNISFILFFISLT